MQLVTICMFMRFDLHDTFSSLAPAQTGHWLKAERSSIVTMCSVYILLTPVGYVACRLRNYL